MKIPEHSKISGIMFILSSLILVPFIGISQEKYQSHLSDISIAGTSTLHDWEMKSDKGQCEATFVLNNKDILTAISSLSFTLPAESLKSGHGMMDDNTYRALKTKSFKEISFVLSSASVTPSGANSYQLKCFGNLTIAGTTHQTDLLVSCKWDPAEKCFYCTGVKKIKMTDYNVKPPTIMMGAIKTGDDISIIYNLKVFRHG